jgi:thiosulfate reductase cytochrome b subunit
MMIQGLLLAAWSMTAAGNSLHPGVPLLDAQGELVVVSRRPLSTMTTCGGDCHDTDYIAASSDHADAGASRLGHGETPHPWQSGPGYFGGWDPLRYDTDGLTDSGHIDARAWVSRYGRRHVGGGPVADLVEMDCLLCHGEPGGRRLRGEWLREGRFEWANSAHFIHIGALQAYGEERHWNAGVFDADGALHDGMLKIRKPADENCAQCHGQVNNSLEQPLVISPDPDDRHDTERTGQLISPQKLLNSGLNIAGKEALDHPFDVHSDRVVGCVNCHYSLNNPVYFRQREESRSEHLEFDPRRLTSADYLRKPLHQFAKGRSTLGLSAVQSENSMRRCESCHAAASVHEWLPFKQRHFSSLACESCHIPRLFGPALESIDWTVLTAAGEPLRRYRGIDGDPVSVDTMIGGFRPVMLPRQDSRGHTRLAPFNLVTSWYWTAGDPARPVTRAQLEHALLGEDGHHPDLVRALDSDGNGELTGRELQLDDESHLEVVRSRLEESGLETVMPVGGLIPFPVSHNVVNGQWATRDCLGCHGGDSVLAEPFPLSAYRPGGILPGNHEYPGVSFAGQITGGVKGGADFIPDSYGAGFYIIGLHGESWADFLGLLMFMGVVAGVTVHATARYIVNRQRPRARRSFERVYMYEAYERLWHWLQATAIMLLLLTGLIIHKPQFFGIFSFPYVVRVHNVLGFILLINAALALFYNLASGEIRQYLPELKGFVGRSVAQAMYYSRGMFAGQPHPLEKSRERKLNPLQQITYLGILNVLLPAQVITGILIWGLQRWPEVAATLGGLPALALVHTLVAWTFAAFIVMHVYLTTTAGHTPTAGIRAMIQGWDEVEDHAGGGIMATIKGWDIFDQRPGSTETGGKQGE